MGLLPLQLLRDRRSSFVELYTTDNFGKTSYGTAGYLGGGYFITVKHAVVALKDDYRTPDPAKIESSFWDQLSGHGNPGQARGRR